MEKIMKTSLDALKYQTTAFQEDCYEQVTSELFFHLCRVEYIFCMHLVPPVISTYVGFHLDGMTWLTGGIGTRLEPY